MTRARLPAFLVVLALLLLAAAPSRADTLEEGAQMTLVADNLDMPVDVAVGPDGAIYYAELTGGLRVIRPGQSSPEPQPLWTPPNLQSGGERGFMGLALDPDFAQTGAFFVFYTHNASGTITNRVSKIVDGEESEVLWNLRSGVLHNSGRITFLPDKTMLVSAGDTILDTAGPHHAVHAHDENDLAGKVLRINRDGTAPADNPFGNEVYTKGHRNVYGIAVSPDGTIIGTENGPQKSDEVNVLVPGKDYGWPTCTGACQTEGFTDPVLEYSPTIAPTGATWHQGYFYFSDFNKGRIHRIYELPNGSWADDRVVRLDQPRILDVESGGDALYFATWKEIYRVTVDARWTNGETPPAPATPTTPTGGDGGDGTAETLPDGQPVTPTPPTDEASAMTPPPAEETLGGGTDTPMPGLVALLATLAMAALVVRPRRR